MYAVRPDKPFVVPIPVLVALALFGFAGNSLLCRAALAQGGRLVDAATFTSVRLASGAFVLALLLIARGNRPREGTFHSALALFAYAAGFSLAYVRIGAGVGALILFGCVQTTMLSAGLLRGERPGAGGLFGMIIAFSGLLLLAAPGASAPDPIGALMMAMAGVAWGVYSLRGRKATNPLGATADNFIRTLPMTAALSLGSLFLSEKPHASGKGLALAIASGALASGVGYSLWYAALPHLSAMRAAIVQLLVPVLAALGSVVFLDESLTSRIVVAGCLLIGGVLLAIRKPTPQPAAIHDRV
jgi:drug/metabolite transporter (DMT)-like permease